MKERRFRTGYMVAGVALFLLCMGSAMGWAGLEFDTDGDCDVDGVNIHAFLSDGTFSMTEDLSGLASELGTVEPCCDAPGSGDPIDGYPKWQERTLMVFVNMVRMAPREYRDKYMADWQVSMPDDGILNADRFPAVHPLYWNLGLNQAARYHAEDMAFNCQTLQHASCDGTSTWDRIARYYSYTGWRGENVADGYSAPRDTVNQFLCDRVGSTCAADGSADDGHRDNIMNGLFKEMGGGHAKGNYHYWVQDFGGRTPDGFPPIVSAAHDFVTSNVTSFFLNYYAPQNGAPEEVRVVVDGAEYLLALDSGQAEAGTYRKDLTTASGCRSYYFMVKTGCGNCYRYPETSHFHTYGEGGCLSDYEK